MLAFGRYLVTHGGKTAFSAADVNDLYREAGLAVPNTSQAITNNIHRGFLTEAPGQKEGAGRRRYVLTREGEERIEART